MSKARSVPPSPAGARVASEQQTSATSGPNASPPQVAEAPADCGAANLVRGGAVLLWGQWSLLVVGKHDQTSEAAEAEHDLLAREHGIAGAGASEEETSLQSTGLREVHGVPSTMSSPAPPHTLTLTGQPASPSGSSGTAGPGPGSRHRETAS